MVERCTAGRAKHPVRGWPTPVLLALILAACASASTDPDSIVLSPLLDVDLAQAVETRPGLFVLDISPGAGELAEAGDSLRVEYIGWLSTGQLFDSSLARGEPLEFRMGANRLIDGWDAGLAGMREGGIRKLVLTPRWGYGREGSTRVPPNSTIVFEIQLLQVRKGAVAGR